VVFQEKINLAIPELVRCLQQTKDVIVELADNRMLEPASLFLVIDRLVKLNSATHSSPVYLTSLST
jgi:hypothetical protein